MPATIERRLVNHGVIAMAHRALPLALVVLAGATAAFAAPADEILTLDNGLVRATVTVRDGRLVGERLAALQGAGAIESDGGFLLELVWAGWQAPGRANNADNAVAFGPAEFVYTGAARVAVADGEELRATFAGPEGLALEIRWLLPRDARFVRRRITVSDPRGRGHFLHALWTFDAAIAGATRVVKAGGFGQPIALTTGDGGGAFLGLEWPSADNRLERRGERWQARCGQEIGAAIPGEGVGGEPVVIAVTPDERVKLAFFDYLDRVRVGRLRPYTLYNSWYDLRSAEYPRVAPRQVMNEENVLRIAGLLQRNMVERYGITLDAFVLDDGWDVYASDWQLRPVQFPRGLAPVVEALRPTGTRLGIWFGPTGGYSSRKLRVGWMREHGYETTGDQMWVGGPRYGGLLEQRTTEMARAGVGYFKWDGFQFLASGPGLGTPPGIYARRAVLERVRAMAAAVRSINPDVFLNITSGTWLSPWWLAIADQIWMGGEDYGAADVPSISTRDSSITYRDLVLHEDFRRHDFWFPLANLMTHGVLKGTIDIGEIGRGEPLTKFADEVVFYLARGVTMHELYVSPDVLSEGEWRVLADALRWARDRFPLLSRTEMVGGDPNQREPYGYVHFRGRAGIVAVRNPDVNPAAITVTLDPAHGLDRDAADLVLERVYPTRWVSPRLWRAGESLELPLAGYEAAVYELRPLAGVAEPLFAGVVFEEERDAAGARRVALLEPGAEAPVLNPEALAGMHVAGRPASSPMVVPARPAAPLVDAVAVKPREDGLAVSFTLAPGARAARLAVLLRPDVPGAAGTDPVARVRVDGVAVDAERVAVEGTWAWLAVPVTPGRHRVAVTLAGGAPWRGSAEAWLVADERVEPLLVEVSSAASVHERPLPWSGRGRFELPRTIRLGATEVAAAVGGPAKK
jgi:hypothetical protein